MMKVLSLLQDEDQTLASKIVIFARGDLEPAREPDDIRHSPKLNAGEPMNRRTVVLAQSLLVAAFFAVPSFAADDEALKKDLTAVIALQGLPCGEVVAVTVQAENDYAVSCKDENKYRVLPECGGAGGCREAEVVSRSVF